MMKFFAIVFASLSLLPVMVQAQDAGYVPPPMFEDPTPPMVRPETATGNLVEPRSSSRDIIPVAPTAPVAPRPVITPEQPKMMKPIIEKASKPAVKMPVAEKPAVVKKEKKIIAAPIPPKKPVAPDAKPAALVEEIVEMPKPAPTVPAPDIAPAVTEAVKLPDPAPAVPIVPAPAAKVISKGVVTGPVTMPAVPTQSVEKQDAFIDLTAPIQPEKTIMERTQEQVQKEKALDEEIKGDAVAVEAKPASNVKPMEFDSTKQDVLKKILPYKPGQIELSEGDLLVIGGGLNAELAKKDKWRIQIRSFATPQGNGVSSDRRIALSRAIALRKSLVDQGIRSSRIDVRAEGLQTDSSQPNDRIDLYLYSPDPKVEIF